jgi:serine/threonine-protein kinase
MRDFRRSTTDASDPEISLTAVDKSIDDITEADSRPIAGESFGKYLLVGELGVGGMAEVFLAIQHGLQGFLKVVTLKRVLPHLATPEFITMFIDEARLAARLEHPNIVKTFEFGEEEGQYYTVMEYLAGEDLGSAMNRAAISKQPVPLNMAAMIVSQLCAGLHFAHDLTDTSGRPLGLVHRDVNPSNVILTYGGEVKIIDFGVAKFNSSSTQTLTGTIKGKIAYMSPEQILARGIDRRSDVFSLGVLLWELVAGNRLFARETDAATLYAIMNDPIPKTRRYRANVPDELESIITTALARTPADRYETAEDMQAALDQFLTTQPKFDARALAAQLEWLFGSTRAEAKRSIAATRALSKNVSLVMKLRSEVRDGLAKQLTGRQLAGAPAPTRTLAFGIAAAALAALLGVLGYLLVRDSRPTQVAEPAATAQASIQLESQPAGAAIFVGGEPTGRTTPATLTGLDPGAIEIRVELAGHRAAARTFQLKSGEAASHRFELGVELGQVVIAGLPAGATVLVGGEEHPAGEVITLPEGRHDVRIVLEDRMLVQQTIETGTGHQVWELRERRLVRK